MSRRFGARSAQHYWEIFQNLTKELGYADYLGALQQYRLQDQHDPKLLSAASYLLDYDFTAQLSSSIGENVSPSSSSVRGTTPLIR